MDHFRGFFLFQARILEIADQLTPEMIPIVSGVFSYHLREAMAKNRSISVHSLDLMSFWTLASAADFEDAVKLAEADLKSQEMIPVGHYKTMKLGRTDDALFVMGERYSVCLAKKSRNPDANMGHPSYAPREDSWVIELTREARQLHTAYTKPMQAHSEKTANKALLRIVERHLPRVTYDAIEA
jgi:hypothetical protein